MGGRYEVLMWGQWWLAEANTLNRDDWFDRSAYLGNNLLVALWTFWRCRHRSGCVTFKFRGEKK